MSTRHRILRAEDHLTMPWANGGGVTHQIAACPLDVPPADVDWRISIADIADDGEFSHLPGIDRLLMLIDGPGMTLTIDEVDHHLSLWQVIAFSGDARVHCHLDAGPTRDLNVMVRSSHYEAYADVLHIEGGLPIAADESMQHWIIVLDGHVSLVGRSAQTLHPGDALLIGEDAILGGTGAVASIIIRRRST